METTMNTYLRAGLLGLLLTGAALSAARAEPTAAAAETLFRATTLNLAASGQVRAAPDIAAISLGVTAEARTAAVALTDNAARMNQVMAALKAAGIAGKDIRTSGLTLNAQYAYEQGQAPRLTGYQAANQVSVTVRDLSRLGAAVDATVGAGANQLRLVSLSEGSASEGARPPVPMMAMARTMKTETPVAPGKLDVRVEVSAVYELNR
jgi:uncharacterized protein YggE